MDITHEFNLAVSTETIYRAVATEKGIQGWWCVNSKVGEQVGTQSLLKFVKEGMKVDMGFTTLVLEENKRVVWECTTMPNPAWIGTRIITEIGKNADGCEVVFSHVGFDEKWAEQEPFEKTRSTWNHFVQSLKDYCKKGHGQPW